jgi:hypothetical protein
MNYLIIFHDQKQRDKDQLALSFLKTCVAPSLLESFVIQTVEKRIELRRLFHPLRQLLKSKFFWNKISMSM